MTNGYFHPLQVILNHSINPLSFKKLKS